LPYAWLGIIKFDRLPILTLDTALLRPSAMWRTA
jgi:hypothetical protein